MRMNSDPGRSNPRIRDFRPRSETPPAPRPQPPGPPPTPGGNRWGIGCGVLVVLGFIVLSGFAAGLDFIVDWQWFTSLGYQAVFTTELGARLGVFAAGTLLAALFLAINWWIARRIAMPGPAYAGQRVTLPGNVIRWIIGGAAALVALIMGLAAADEWSTVLQFIQQVPFGQTDPIFHQDIGFFVFSLPFYEFLRGFGIGLVVVAFLGAGAIYLTRPGLFGSREGFNLDGRVGVHLAVLGAIFLVLIAWGYALSGYNLMFSDHGPLYGLSYTDEHARLLAYRILLVVTLAGAAVLLLNLFLRRWMLLVGVFGVWLLVLALVDGIYPAFVQNFQVKPSELALEQPYIVNHIAATRAAFGLDKFNEQAFDAADSPTQADLSANAATVNNIRLWDYRPLLDVFTQLQAIRSYYVFNQQNGVDIDRYPLAGGERQVMIAAREMDVTRLADQAATWLNQHLVYTHGYGAVVVPVNAIESAGLPQFLVKDLPPVASDPVLNITQPRIYFGEAEDNYIFVDTGQPEFDYPLSSSGSISGTGSLDTSGNATTTYTGTAGIRLGNIFNKLLFSLYFGDANVLLSEYVTDQTRVVFHRDIHEAVPHLAPFLQYDHDPYVVIADGRLYWIWDAYTTTDHYPYSKPYVDANGNSYNYIRNSVKVVVDAYNGTTTYYVFDPTDPIIQTYRRIFPTLFHDSSEMPASLKAHIRYPESLFNVQAEMFAIFHMTDPTTFYGQEDAWKVPFGSSDSGVSLPAEAYYNIMRVPGEQQEEFLLMAPFTPATRQNMIAWMAAKGDEPGYGRVDIIRFPKSKTFYGPEQIGALINRDPQISQDLSLWNQQGSQVVRGNLLVIPVANSVIYVEPLFIQATSGGGLPGLQRVIAVLGNGVGYGADLKSALLSAFTKQAGGTTLPPPMPTPGPGTPVPTLGVPTPVSGTPGACPGDAVSYAASAQAHFQRSQDALKQGDWATYGAEQAALAADLRCLQQVTH